ncbi:efflux pump antibiotic resistance protein [hydrocarbon metagenome]|uniref:Efflux pump antibiotic resistance protein n=1 Tax=hydrocarbon metagenome TaxID=938273 RepID=A0A0W8E877_9ZZZZ
MENNISKNQVLVTIAIASFLTPFMLSATNIALPSIQRDFAANAVMLSWIATSFLLSTAVFLVPAGKIADIYGRKKLFIIGVVIFTLASLLSAFVPSIEWLILMRIFQGLGGSIVMTTAVAILTSVYPPRERGKALGVNVSMVYIGLASGPTLGGLLTTHLGWRSIFFMAVPLGIITVLLTIYYLKGEWADAQDEKLDIGGSLIYAFSLIAVTYGLTLLPAPSGILYLLVGLLGAAAFVKSQLSARYPVFNVRLFKNNRVFAFSNIAALINYGATAGVTFLLSLYLQYIKGMPPQTAGLVLIVQPIIQALLSPAAGKLSDKIEPRLIASLGMASTSLGLFLLIFLHSETSIPYIITTLIVLGVGFALFGSPNTNAVMGSVSRQYYGIASGSVSTMRLLGQNFSMALATLMITLYIGKAPITPPTYDLFLASSHISFSIFTLLCIVGIYFSYSRGKMHTVDDAAEEKHPEP